MKLWIRMLLSTAILFFAAKALSPFLPRRLDEETGREAPVQESANWKGKDPLFSYGLGRI